MKNNHRGVLVGVIAIIIAIWILITMVFRVVSSTILPSPVDLAFAFVDLAPLLGEAILSSLKITFLGLGLGLVVGIGMGMGMAYSKGFMDVVGPIMEFTRPIPVFALIPLFMLWFGLGQLPQILLIALGVSAIMGVQTYESIRNIPMVYVRAAFNLGANKGTVFRTVVIPYIVPHLIGAVRVAAASAWGLDVAAEMMGVQVGLGYTMIVQQVYLNIPGIIAIVLIYSVLAILLDRVIQIVQKRWTRWTDREAMTFEGLMPIKKKERKNGKLLVEQGTK